MARRPSAYDGKEADNTMDKLSAKLSADLRGSIRALGTFPLLSEAWCKMATTLGRVAEISDAEAKLARECSTGARKEGGKTLWEGEVVESACIRELALRYVLEDGKLNVCLRNLVDWREFDRGRPTTDLLDEKPSVRESLDSFEKGMGTVLRNAWSHIEALQTTDIPLLVQYITGVINEATEDPERIEKMSRRGDLKDRQEVVCISYLRGLMSRLVEYDEDRVMPMLRSAGTTAALAKMLHTNHAYLGEEANAVGAETLAHVCATEDFSTYRDEYIRNEDKATFASLKMDFVADLCKDPKQKKTLRPLLDAISYCERSRTRK